MFSTSSCHIQRYLAGLCRWQEVSSNKSTAIPTRFTDGVVRTTTFTPVSSTLNIRWCDSSQTLLEWLCWTIRKKCPTPFVIKLWSKGDIATAQTVSGIWNIRFFVLGWNLFTRGSMLICEMFLENIETCCLSSYFFYPFLFYVMYLINPSLDSKIRSIWTIFQVFRFFISSFFYPQRAMDRNLSHVIKKLKHSFQ